MTHPADNDAPCGAVPPNVVGPVPCHLPTGHGGKHFSTTGCPGSEIRWGEHAAENDRIASIEPGCTCGGVAACPQCQNRDAARFLPKGFEFDAAGRVSRPCPTCGGATYAPGPSGWASRYWLHSETSAYACPIPPGESA